mgnify:CR=1 FL=1
MIELENCEDFCDFAPIEQCMEKKEPMSIESIIRIKQYAEEHPEKIKASTKKWRENNREKVRGYLRKSAKKQWEKCKQDPVLMAKFKEYHNSWYRKKYRNDPVWRMKKALQNKMYKDRKNNESNN